MRTEMHGPCGPYLAFGLLLTPRWLARSITDQIEAHTFAELDCADAARVLEGVAYLQWVKAGIVGGISSDMRLATCPDPFRLWSLRDISR